MARREHTDKYAGQALGWAWAIIHPLLLMGVYVFVFAVVFQQRIGGTTDFPLDYTAYVLTGLACWLNVQDSLTRTCVAVTSKSELVKQVVFPVEILPVKSVLAAQLSQFVAIAVVLAYSSARFGLRPSVLLLGPVAVLLQATFLVGVGSILSAVSVFFRDIKEFVQIFSFVGVYVIPAFYLPSWVPNGFGTLLLINPASHFVWCFQDAFFYGRVEHPASWAVASALALLSVLLGSRVFSRLKPMFGNFL